MMKSVNKNVKHLSGLKFLITYDKFTGNTYWGSSIDGKQTKLRKTVQILWNILISSLIISDFYTTFKRFLFKYLNKQLINYNSTLLYGIYGLGFICFISQTLLNTIFLFLRGKYILDNLKAEQIVKIDKRYEKRVGIYIIVIKIVISIMQCIVCIFYEGVQEFFQMDYITILYQLFLLFVSSNTRLHVISLIAYKCLIVSKQIQNIIGYEHRIRNIGIKTLNMRTIYQIVNKIYKSFKCFDRLVL